MVDGASADNTIDLIKSNDEIVSTWISEPDCGVYDALNKAVKMANGEFYLVCGADDVLSVDAIENYQKFLARTSDCDVVVAGVEDSTGHRLGYHPHKGWLGHVAMFTHHSVGTLIRRALQETHGYYDLRFAVLADGLFLKRLAADPKVKISAAGFIAGRFASGGISGGFLPRSLFEMWIIQLLTEPRPLLQTGIYVLRILKHFGHIIADVGRLRRNQ